MVSGGKNWRHVQTCSLENSLSDADILWWLPKHVQSGSGRYASCFNAFLLSLILVVGKIFAMDLIIISTSVPVKGDLSVPRMEG